MRIKPWFTRSRRKKKEAEKMSFEILRLIEEEGKYCTEIAKILGLSYSNTYNYIQRLESSGAI